MNGEKLDNQISPILTDSKLIGTYIYIFIYINYL
jgi:hypothetical protein